MKLLPGLLLIQLIFILNVLFLELLVFKGLTIVIKAVCLIRQSVLVVPQIFLRIVWP